MADKKGFNSIVPEQDERIGARGSSAGGRAARPKPAPSPSAGSRSGGAGGVWKTLVMILLLATAAAGWFGWQQHQQLAALQSNFDELNQRLASTDDSLSKSGDALLLKIKEQKETLEKHWSEIRKLWGVSNDRNKKQISKNEKAVTSNSSRIATLQKSTASLGKLTKQQELNNKKIADISSTSLSVSAEIEDLQQRLQRATDKLRTMEDSFNSWQREVNGRLSKSDEAIESIDAYRRQINQELLQLRNQLSTSAGNP